MQMLRVVATMAAPVVAAHDVHLDGILEQALYRRMARMQGWPEVTRETDVASLPRLPLPVASVKALGLAVRLASAWDLPAEARVAQHHKAKRRDTEDTHRIARAFTPGAGPDRNLLFRVQAVETPTIAWRCFGDRREVRKLLDLIPSVGSHRRDGSGQVQSWAVEPSDEPLSRCLVREDGAAARHIPAAWSEELPRAWGAWCGPYWHPSRQCPVIGVGDRLVLRKPVEESLRGVAP